MPNPHKLVVCGVGHVGSYVLADAMKMNLFGEIITIDSEHDVAHGEALDQHQATGLHTLSSTSVRAGTYADCVGADVIIVAAGPSMIPDPNDPDAKPDRAALAPHNAQVIREVMAGITRHTRDAVIILITNPLDTMVYIAENEFDYPAGKIFGTGTMLDSARLRRIVADRLGVSPLSVEGYMLGEHGLSAFPALSHLTVAGMGPAEIERVFGVHFDPAELATAVVNAAYEVFGSKGWTNAGVAASAVAMARAILLDERTIFPTCTTLRGEYGYDGTVALSLPTLIGAGGAQRRFELTLDEWESQALRRTVAAIQDAMKAADVQF
ncbi:lactate/malate family dehydrogenase [Corynebacterium epidermidicanis]|uniref:Malate/lactate dehydrogenase n=1 Tax=Corynebacterium epidermidicanis TaxID=1050174 RepID=A0A0G3GUA9_9CORY|nr:lactate dehydrogenase [Corynebacterium epidermidicanis]AKK02467.1 malate/lactate dehydrogenase [Corynebacterium epidermidicanis]